MQYLKPCTQGTTILFFVLLAGVHLGESAPHQSGFLLVPSVPFNFPEAEVPQQQEPKENPEPRHVLVEQPAELTQKDLEQLLLLAQTQTQPQGQVQGRKFGGHFGHKSDDDMDKDKDKHKHHHDSYTFVILPYGNGTGSVLNNITNTAVNNPTGTGTRTNEVLRTPVAYPVPYPMQYPPAGYPALYGWNEPSLYGGLPGSGLGGLNGFRSLAGVPLVPITVGNQVRYVPLNLRMFRQLVNLPVREKDDLLEEDDLTPFNVVNGEQDPQETIPEEEVTNEGDTGYAALSQRRKQLRRRPLQAFTQKLRQVQYQ
ncbi:hypothetical protein KR054_012395 [Drosophila jambulina]|nr:hypothetical protein KR054_012395 [Drosophila jambulina]